jgi:hypothetical protein
MRRCSGFVYRWAIRIKDFGERVHCLAIVRLELAVKEFAWKK